MNVEIQYLNDYINKFASFLKSLVNLAAIFLSENWANSFSSVVMVLLNLLNLMMSLNLDLSNCLYLSFLQLLYHFLLALLIRFVLLFQLLLVLSLFRFLSLLCIIASKWLVLASVLTNAFHLLVEVLLFFLGLYIVKFENRVIYENELVGLKLYSKFG